MGDQVRVERVLAGFWGLGLLRGWPYDDPDRAEMMLAKLASIASRAGDPVPIDVFDPVDAYSAWADTYDVVPNGLIQEEEPMLRELIAGLAPGRAVDVACGTGRVTAILAEISHEVTGIDPSPEMLALGRAKGIDATFVDGDLSALPIADAHADVVTCALALTHLEDLSGPIDEIARIVRPGGHVVLSDIHPIAAATGGHAWFRRDDGTRAVTRNHVHWPSDYIRAFQRSGLRILRCEEPRVTEGFIAGGGVASEEVREAIRNSLVGLPLVLLWLLRRD